eukprot:TRINITY_DN3420_c0_g1_i3.p1 TRINITY_DN3420_c0_g1~~TRINITY_DN3420_c0_g1_i3.p1  ORF type:complete len:448 (+),score=98.12 TRINITY_DN3420_c0_g1_i3:91-1434(+)
MALAAGSMTRSVSCLGTSAGGALKSQQRANIQKEWMKVGNVRPDGEDVDKFKKRADDHLKRRVSGGTLIKGSDVEKPDPKKVFSKGSFSIEKGGLAAYNIDRPELLKAVEGSAGETIDFSEHAQDIFHEFLGATDVDWEEVFDLVINRDTYNRRYIRDWEKREPNLVRYFVALHSLLYIMEDIYLVNPHRRLYVVPQLIASSNRLEEKTAKAGWWQEAFRKMLVRNLVEEVPYLKCIATTANHVKKQTRYHMRNMVNTYLAACTKRIASKDMSEFLKQLESIWGSYFMLLLETLGVDFEEYPEAIEACSHMGKAYGMIFAIESICHAKVTNCVFLPQEVLTAANVDLQVHLNSQKYGENTKELIRALLLLMQSESNLAGEKARSLPYHYKQLAFFRYRADCKAYSALWKKLDYTPPISQDDESFKTHTWVVTRYNAYFGKRLRMNSV